RKRKQRKTCQHSVRSVGPCSLARTDQELLDFPVGAGFVESGEVERPARIFDRIALDDEAAAKRRLAAGLERHRLPQWLQARAVVGDRLRREIEIGIRG